MFWNSTVIYIHVVLFYLFYRASLWTFSIWKCTWFHLGNFLELLLTILFPFVSLFPFSSFLLHGSWSHWNNPVIFHILWFLVYILVFLFILWAMTLSFKICFISAFIYLIPMSSFLFSHCSLYSMPFLFMGTLGFLFFHPLPSFFKKLF